LIYLFPSRRRGADTKLVPSWRMGHRSVETAIEFVCDLSRNESR
jgi:hypothetical protein